MQLTAFAPIGLLRCSSKPPPSAAIYESLIAAYGGDAAYDTSVGSRIEAQCFARALGMARRQARLEQAAAQRLASQASFLLPRREREHGILPSPSSTLAQRRAVLQERFFAPRGGSAFEIREMLTRLLGDDFVAYHPTDVDDAVLSPAAIGDQPMNLQRPDVERKLCQLSGAVSGVGVDVTVGFTMTSGSTLQVGDVVVFDPGRWGIADRVTVEAIGGTTEAPTLTATFTKPHAAGAWGTTMPYPEWSSTKRHSRIVLRAAAAADPEKRRIVNERMRGLSRATSTWDIVEASEDESETVAFQLDEPSLDIRTLAVVPLP